jgi:hypothetical protein
LGVKKNKILFIEAPFLRGIGGVSRHSYYSTNQGANHENLSVYFLFNAEFSLCILCLLHNFISQFIFPYSQNSKSRLWFSVPVWVRNRSIPHSPRGRIPSLRPVER